LYLYIYPQRVMEYNTQELGFYIFQ
jgi:hypothetical protein